jgi:hypothetical protein
MEGRMISDFNDVVGVAIKLDDIHQAVTRIHGDNFPTRVTQWEPIIRGLAEEKHRGNLIAAATEITKDPDLTAPWIMLILAVAVELTHRDVAAATQQKAKPAEGLG